MTSGSVVTHHIIPVSYTHLTRLYSFDTYWLPRSECKIKGLSILRLALAFFIVSITQDTSNVLESVQAMIFLEYKSIILVR